MRGELLSWSSPAGHFGDKFGWCKQNGFFCQPARPIGRRVCHWCRTVRSTLRHQTEVVIPTSQSGSVQRTRSEQASRSEQTSQGKKGSKSCIASRPYLSSSSFRKIVTLHMVWYSPFLTECLRAARRRIDPNLAFVDLLLFYLERLSPHFRQLPGSGDWDE